MTESSPVEWSELMAHTAGDEALARELLALFLNSARRYIDDMAAAPDGETWRRLAHTLKGAALSVGAPRLAALALAAERLDDRGSRDRTVQNLRVALDAVRRYANGI
ncbi:MAG TPA: Hpt domain-containing protein [Candidatus Cybelea sp.]|nr:Hpt domain-containing protein [Candidatus Cybelea sp.]